MAKKRGGQSRESFVNKMRRKMEKDAVKALKKEGKDEEANETKSKVVPNRAQLRASGLRPKQVPSTPHSRIPSGNRKTPASLYTMIAIHQQKPDGTTVKFVMPKNMLQEGNQNAE